MQLRIEQPDQPPRIVQLDPAITTRIGTHAAAEIHLTGQGIQPVHGGIVHQGGQFRVAAAKSAGKLAVNGALVPNAVLKPGDRITIGPCVLCVVGAAAAQPKAPAPVAEDLEVLEDDPLGGLTPILGDDLEVLDDGLGGGLQTVSGDLGSLLGGLGDASADPFASGGFGAGGLGAGGLGAGGLGGGLGMSPTMSMPGMNAPGMSMPGMGLPGAAQYGAGGMAGHAGMMPPPGAAGATTAAPRQRGRLSLVFKLIGASLFVIPAIGLIALLVSSLPTPADEFAAAEADYRAQRYQEAEAAFQGFLRSYPGDSRAGDARAMRGLSRLNPLIKRGGDWAVILESADRELDQLGPSAHLPQAQSTLSELLPQLAVAMTERAKATAAQADAARAASAVAEAQLAMALVRKHLPPAARMAKGVDAIELQLTELDRGLKQAEALSAALAAIAASNADLDAALAARAGLLDDYPQLTHNAALTESLAKLATNLAARVEFTTVNESPVADSPVGPFRLAAALASRTGPTVAAPAAVVPLDDWPNGAVWGLDAASGQVLWRQFVGFDSQPPLGSVAGGTLLVDADRGELLRLGLPEGKVDWRQAPGDFVARPVIAGTKALVATRSGALVEINVQGGAVVGRCQLPQPLSVGPAVESSRCFQLADRAMLYVLDLDRRATLGVAYAGHEAGAITLPPIIHGGGLVVVANDGPRDTRLSVFSLADQPELLHVVDLPGKVSAPPVAHGDWLFVAAGATVHSLQFALDQPRQPPRRGPTIVSESNRDSAVRAVVAGNRLWIGGNGLTEYELPPGAGGFAQVRRLFSSEHIEQLSVAADRVVSARRTVGGGLLAACIGPNDLNAYWQTRIATPLAAPPTIDAANNDWLLANAAGAWGSVTTARLNESAPLIVESPASLSGNSPTASARANPPIADAQFISVAGQPPWLAVPGRSDLLRLATAGTTSESLALPGVLASRPAPLGDRWLIPLAEGPLFLLDPSGRQPPSAPLLPTLDPASPARWLSPVALPGGGAVVASANGRVLRVAVSSDGQLTLAAEAALAVSLIAEPVVADDTVWLATEQGDLTALTLPDLIPAGNVPLGGAPAWGPRAIGGNALVATRDGRMLSLRGAPTPTWEVDLSHGPIVGAVAVPGGPIVLSTRSGMLYGVAADTGQSVGAAVEVGQRLAGDPVVAGDRLLIVMADGSLHVSTQPLSTLFLASASTAARTQPRD